MFEEGRDEEIVEQQEAPVEDDLFSPEPLGDGEQVEFDEIFGSIPDVDEVTAGLEEAQALEDPKEVETPPPPAPEVERQVEPEPIVETRQETAEPDVVQSLRSQLAELSRVVQERSAEIETLRTERSAPVEAEIPEFIENDDRYQEALLSREAMNSLLADVYRKMVAKTREVTLADAGRAASTIARNTVQQARMVTGFYEANEDLLPYRDYVAFELKNMAASNPQMSAEEALRELGPLVRRKVGLGTQNVQSPPVARKTQQKPAFPGRAPSRPPSKQSIGQLEQEFNDVVFGLQK